MAVFSAIMPPATLGEAIRTLRDLSVFEFESLVAAVSGPRSFSLSKEQLEALRSQIPAHAPRLNYLLAALTFLYNQVTHAVESGMPYADAISAATDELEKEAEWGPKKGEVRSRLELLLQSKESHTHFRKIQRLQSGFLPNAVGFSTFVDLRPDFGEGENVVLKGYLPVIQFRVTTDSSSPDLKRLVFQMSEDALIELRRAVDRAEEKLAALRKTPIALQLIKI
jgi:hypothetical protein